MVSRTETRYSTRVVERAVDVLFCLANAEEPVGVTEIAGQLELSKATVFRLLQTLAGKGLVGRTAGEPTYGLMPKVVALGVRFLPQGLPAIARPYLEKLRDASGETATLSIRAGDQRLFLDVLPSRLEVKMVPEMGRPVSLVRGASGKLLLAFAEPEARTRIVRAAFNGRPKREVEAYLAELAQLRRDGHATSVHERTPGASSIAAAIRDRSGSVVATVALSAPTSRFDEAAMKRMLPTLIDTAGEISRELGYTPGARRP